MRPALALLALLFVQTSAHAASITFDVIDGPLRIDGWREVRVRLVLEPGEEAYGLRGGLELDGPVTRYFREFDGYFTSPWAFWYFWVDPIAPHVRFTAQGPLGPSTTIIGPDYTPTDGPIILAWAALTGTEVGELVVRAVNLVHLDRVDGIVVETPLEFPDGIVARVSIVPEPGTLSLLAAGIAVLLARRR